jgi:hypothetical protein
MVALMYLCNIEPSLDELLDDATMRLLLSRDGTSADAVRALVSEAKRKLAPSRPTEAARASLSC